MNVAAPSNNSKPGFDIVTARSRLTFPWRRGRGPRISPTTGVRVALKSRPEVEITIQQFVGVISGVGIRVFDWQRNVRPSH